VPGRGEVVLGVGGGLGLVDGLDLGAQSKLATQRALAIPSLAAYLSNVWRKTAVTSAPHSGCRVRSANNSNSTTSPGT
jgi:hypothetical protein